MHSAPQLYTTTQPRVREAVTHITHTHSSAHQVPERAGSPYLLPRVRPLAASSRWGVDAGTRANELSGAERTSREGVGRGEEDGVGSVVENPEPANLQSL